MLPLQTEDKTVKAGLQERNILVALHCDDFPHSPGDDWWVGVTKVKFTTWDLMNGQIQISNKAAL